MVTDGGVQVAGHEAVDTDVVRPPAVGQVDGHRLQGALAGRVRAAAEAAYGGDGRDVDDGTATATDEVGMSAAGHLHGRGDIEGEGLVPARSGGAQERAVATDTGVVDDRVEVPGPDGEVIHRSSCRFVVGDVRSEGDGPAAAVLDTLPGVLGSPGVDVEDADGGSLGGQQHCRGRPGTQELSGAAGPGHQSRPACHAGAVSVGVPSDVEPLVRRHAVHQVTGRDFSP